MGILQGVPIAATLIIWRAAAVHINICAAVAGIRWTLFVPMFVRIPRCLKCQRVACLHHAFLGPTGDGVCLACAGITIKAPPQKDHAAVIAAFSFLQLDPNATEAFAKKHVQKLQAQAHPDKHKEGSAKHAEATKAFKSIGTAFDAIKKARGWA